MREVGQLTVQLKKGGDNMAKTVSIATRENAAKIVVDGNEISDVLSYKLEEGPRSATLTLEIAVTETIEVQK